MKEMLHNTFYGYRGSIFVQASACNDSNNVERTTDNTDIML